MRGVIHAGRARPATLFGAAAVGLAGWLFLAFAPMLMDGAGLVPPDALSFVMFLFVIVAARAMATRLLPDTAVALDSAFYVAATLCLGSVAAGRMVAIALTVDSVWRIAGVRIGRIGRHESAPWQDGLSFLFYFGGMSGALLTLVAWLFGVDRVAATGGVSDVALLGTVLGTGLVFLLAHYSIQGVRLMQLGAGPQTYVLRMVPAILGEAALLPLAAVVVILFDPERPMTFILVGATYLLANYTFHRLARTREDLRLRVAELETLNVTAHQLASSLHTHELVDVVARETIFAIPEADLFVLAHRPDEKSELVVDCFARGGAVVRVASDAEPIGELVARVLADNASVDVGDVTAVKGGSPGGRNARGQSPAHPASDRDELSEIRAWFGVPLEIHGEVAGVLAVCSETPHAFAPDRRRLLESIGSQAAVALENARLYELAMVDGLTGLFVRRYLDARLDEEVERCKRFGSEFSVVMMDIDDFKHLNDTFGHQVGDRILRAVADAVRRELRAVDTAARYGGEEFAMILPRTSMVEAYNLAERARERIAGQRLDLGDNGEVAATASFGIASYPEGGAADAEQLVKQADLALYRAKRTGKNRVELYWGETAS